MSSSASAWQKVDLRQSLVLFAEPSSTAALPAAMLALVVAALPAAAETLEFLFPLSEGGNTRAVGDEGLEAMGMSARKKKVWWRHSETGWGEMVHPPQYL